MFDLIDAGSTRERQWRNRRFIEPAQVDYNILPCHLLRPDELKQGTRWLGGRAEMEAGSSKRAEINGSQLTGWRRIKA